MGFCKPRRCRTFREQASTQASTHARQAGKNKERRNLPIGTVYQPTNISGQRGQRAASDVLHTDALVCEDSTTHNMPRCRSPTDYETYYNVIERASSEAAEECIGIPNEARALTAEAFEGLSIEIETRWVPTPAVKPDFKLTSRQFSLLRHVTWTTSIRRRLRRCHSALW